MASVTDTLTKISALKPAQQSSILRLAEPLLPAEGTEAEASAGQPIPTPHSLEVDLEHYKVLFSKLRFSYLEQVTKEKFLRAIVGDPPLIVENEDCVELEAQLVTEKARLKAEKEEVRLLVEELEQLSARIAKQYDEVTSGSQRLEHVEHEANEIIRAIEGLKSQLPADASDIDGWSLAQVNASLAMEQEESDMLDQQLQHLDHSLPEDMAEVQSIESELQPLEVQRLGTIAAAGEARRRKEGRLIGQSGDEVEEYARWLRAQEAVLKRLLG